MTPLEVFLKMNKLKPAKVAREAGISRQHLLRLRKGTADATMMTAMRLRNACGRMISRQLSLSDLFEV